MFRLESYQFSLIISPLPTSLTLGLEREQRHHISRCKEACDKISQGNLGRVCPKKGINFNKTGNQAKLWCSCWNRVSISRDKFQSLRHKAYGHNLFKRVWTHQIWTSQNKIFSLISGLMKTTNLGVGSSNLPERANFLPTYSDSCQFKISVCSQRTSVVTQ